MTIWPIWHFHNPDSPDLCLCGAVLDDENHHRKCPLDVYTYAKGVDMKRKDRQYWRDVFKDMEEKGIGHIVAHNTHLNRQNRFIAVKYMKQLRYDARREQDRKRLCDPVIQYGVVIGTQINNAIKKASAGESCVDNERWARKHNSPDRRRYAKAKKSGCCGFHDEEIVIDGETYLIGFNYGH